MTRDQAVAKIKKCLALAKSANPNEAAVAMRQAQALMAQHMIAPDDIALSAIKTLKCSAPSNSGPAWETALASVVAQAFGCGTIWTRDYCLTGARALLKRKVIFYGVESAPEIAGYAWDVLSRQCAKGRLVHIRLQPSRCKPITRTARGDQYAIGWVVGVHEKLERFANPEKTQLLLEQFAAATWPNSKSVPPRDRTVGRNVRPADFVIGVRHGALADLNHGVGGAVSRPALAFEG